MATIHSKSEAQSLAEALKSLPDEIINDVNQAIVNGYAHCVRNVTFSRTNNINNSQWRALGIMLEQKGYKVRMESCQRDGMWMSIEL